MAREQKFETILQRQLGAQNQTRTDECPDAAILASYYDRSLTLSERQRYEGHFSSCGYCSQQLASLARADATVQPQPTRAASFLRWQWVTPVAALAAVLTLAVVTVLRFNSRSQPLSTELAQSTAPGETADLAAKPAAPTPPTQLALNAAPAPPPPAAQREEMSEQSSPRTVPEPSHRLEAKQPKPKVAKQMRAPLAGERFAARASAPGALKSEANPAEPRPGAAAPPSGTGVGGAGSGSLYGPNAVGSVVGAPGAGASAPQPPPAEPAFRAPAAEAENPSAPAAPPPAAIGGTGVLGAGSGALIGGPSPTTNSAQPELAGQSAGAAKKYVPNSSSAAQPGRAAGASRIMVRSPDGTAVWSIGPRGKIARLVNQQTWQPQQSGVTTDLFAGSAPSPSVCWVVGESGAVLRTVDAENWTAVSAPTGANLISVTASDENSATVVARDGSTFTTSDGGRTWQPE
jgi:hypothetical protein